MNDIPDAPYIRECERCGTDYVYSWLLGEEQTRECYNEEKENLK